MGLYDALESSSAPSFAAPPRLAVQKKLPPHKQPQKTLPPAPAPVSAVKPLPSFRPPPSLARSQPLLPQPLVSKQISADLPSSLHHPVQKRKRTDKSQRPAVSLSDEYDPARPNEYESIRYELKRYKEQERQRKIDEALERRKRRKSTTPDSDESEPYQKNSPPPRTPSIPVDSSVETPVKELVFIPPPPTVTIQLDMSGEEAYLMRMRMSGMTESDLPNTIPIPDIPDDDDDDDDIDGAPITKTQDQDIDGAPMNNIEEEDEDLDGEPLNENIDGELLSIADISHSTVLLLTNMVGRTEVDDTLESETFEECSNFGPVEKCVIHVIPFGKCTENEAVRIFVKFKDETSARKACETMKGRYFNRRLVGATLFDEGKFQRNEYL